MSSVGLSNSAFSTLGLSNGTTTDGFDVAGTINGEEAEGKGKTLTGAEGNEYTDGLQLLIHLNSDQIGTGHEAFVTPTRGLATQMDDLLDELTASEEGTFDRQISIYEKHFIPCQSDTKVQRNVL